MKKAMVILAMVVVFGLGFVVGKGYIVSKYVAFQMEKLENKIVQDFESQGHEVWDYEIKDLNNYTVSYKDGNYGNYRIFEHHENGYSDKVDDRSNIARSMVVTLRSATKGE